MILALAALAASVGTGDLVHYFSHGPGNPPEVKVDQTALCSNIGSRDIKEQFQSGQKGDQALKIDRVEISCSTKAIATYWIANPTDQDASERLDQDRARWTNEVCYRHELFFIAHSGWKVSENIDLNGGHLTEADAQCDGYSLADTDIMRR